MPSLCLMVAMASLAGASPVDGTLESLCQSHEARVRGLFAAIDLGADGLETAREAVQQEDWPEACRALLDHYRTRLGTPPAPPLSTAVPRPAEAEAMLKGSFTFYGQPDAVPQRPGGGLDWSHLGPASDREWGWGLNRHWWLQTLLAAFEATGDERYAAALDAYLADWVLANPYPAKRSDTPQWRGLEATARVRSWAPIFRRLQGIDAFRDTTRILLLSSIPDHAHYLRHFHAPSSNWITMEMNGLAAAAITWPEFRDSQAWLDYAVDSMIPELEQQVYPDGVQNELTSHYHRVAAGNFEGFAEQVAAARGAMPSPFAETLEAMWNYLAYSMRPNGHGLLNNDSDYDHTAPLLHQKADRYRRPDWQYIVTHGAEGTPPKKGPSIFFPWAGQAVMRSAWDPKALWAFFDVGPLGTGHVHYDKLHLSVAAYGRDLLVDSGRYTYAPSPWRDYFKGSWSHNVVLVDGAEQKPFRSTAKHALDDAFEETPDYVFARGRFDTGYRHIQGRPAHQRNLLYVKNRFWVVVDHIDTGRPRDLTALWHFHPDCTVVEEEDRELVTTDAGVGNLRLVPLADFPWTTQLVRGQETPAIQGWYSVRYNTKVPATTAVYSGHIDNSATFAWLLLPAEGDVPKAKVKRLRLNDDDARMSFRWNEVDYRLRIPLEGQPSVTVARKD